MLKQVLHKLFSITMALLLLLSTGSFTVEKRYCEDVLIDVAVFSQIEKCALECFETEQEQITITPCCKDTLDVVQGQKQLTVKTFDDLEIFQQQFLASYLYAYNSLFEVLQKQTIPHQNYYPPNLITDIQVLDQVFLV